MNDDPDNQLPRGYTLRWVLLLAQLFLIPAGVAYAMLALIDWRLSGSPSELFTFAAIILLFAGVWIAWQYRGLCRAEAPPGRREGNPASFVGAVFLFTVLEAFLACVYFCAGCAMMLDKVFADRPHP